jgi:nicotinate-nucleotide adenylyltransferase
MSKPKKVGLFFGSFNPVHVGHMIIANLIASDKIVDEVWMVVSPHNPLKDKASLANDYERLHMVNLAIGNNVLLKASNVEFNLPKPSYTIDTLTVLQEKYPHITFSLIMGGDNLGTLHKWKNYEALLKNYQILVYSRPNYELGEYASHPNVRLIDAPLLEISSSFIRQCIKDGRSIKYLVTEDVYQYLAGSSMYKGG